MRLLARRTLNFFVDSWLVAAGAILWPAGCAALHALGLTGRATGLLLLAGLAATLALSIRQTVTNP